VTAGAGPLVSVVVPTRDYGHLVGETLRSLQAQTYPHWECFVVDDGSIDDTRQVVCRHAAEDQRIHYLDQPRRGPAAARNTGIRASAGAHLQFLDSDDLLERRKVERHVAYLKAHPDVDLVYGGARYFATDPVVERRHSMDATNTPWMPNVSGTGPEILSNLVRGNIMVISAPLLRRGVVADVGLFDEQLPLSLLEDWDYWLRCAAAGKCFHYVDEPETLALVRSHPGSLTKVNTRRMLKASLHLRRKVDALVDDPATHALNRDIAAATERWLRMIHAISTDLTRLVPPGTSFILVDDDMVRNELIVRSRPIPFLERDGQYWGPAPDAAVAVEEMERLRRAGARYIVFAWPAFWWLEYYEGLRRHLEWRFPRLKATSELLVAFDLSSA
jgi:glycosyltransferase involved in cell wall biosynthesis